MPITIHFRVLILDQALHPQHDSDQEGHNPSRRSIADPGRKDKLPYSPTEPKYGGTSHVYDTTTNITR
jgi:hypothetical protein